MKFKFLILFIGFMAASSLLLAIIEFVRHRYLLVFLDSIYVALNIFSLYKLTTFKVYRPPRGRE